MIYLANLNLSQNELQNAVIQPLATPPATPKLGQIYCNSATSKIMWYNGSSWKTIGVVVESSATNGHIVVDGVDMSVYTLPIATSSVLGGVKIGAGLTIDANGVLSATGGGVADSVAWENVVGKPTALSAFTNDQGFITSSVNNLTNYYKKSETYTQAEVNTLIGQLQTIQISVVSQLPATGSSNIIYLVPKQGGTAPNAKDEYLWTGSAFEKIGDTEIDLSDYVQNSELAAVAKTGNYASLTNRPQVYIHTAAGSIDSGNTSITISTVASGTLSPDGIVSVNAYDSMTVEPVIVDWDLNPSNGVVTVNIASSYTNSISVVVTYLMTNQW